MGNFFKRNYKVVDSKSPVPEVDNLRVQLDSIRRIQDQINFASSQDVLSVFQIYFKVELRRLAI